MSSSYLIWSCLAVATLVIFDTMIMANPHHSTISMNGLKATISFIPRVGNVSIKVNVSSSISNSDFLWAVYEFPMLYDRTEPCAAAFIGSVYNKGFGNLTKTHGTLSITESIPLYFVNSNITFEGSESLSGRTIVLQSTTDSNIIGCASILPDGDVITAVATFQYPVAGTVTFRQLSGSLMPAATTIYVDLLGTTTQEFVDLNWHIYNNNGYSPEMTLEEQCGSTINSVINLTKLATLDIHLVSPTKLYYFVDPDLSLEGPDSVLGMTLILLDSNDINLACSPIRIMTPKSVKCSINSKNITGSISFIQRSPWEATSLTVDLQNLQNRIGGFHIHSFPLPPRYFESDDLASLKSVARHWNPYGITSFPEEIIGTEDQYEVGDISRKFGQLTGLDFINETYIDWNMPLFGSNSIIGRSIILHLVEGRTRFAYGQISYPTPFKTVVIDFKAPVTGTIVLRQALNDPLAETTVFVDLANVDGTATDYHNWHVHVKKSAKDYFDENSPCLDNGGHFNPFSVDLTQNYGLCSQANPRRCEVGDFSGKHGKLTIADTLHTLDSKAFYTDVQLPLSGAYSIDDGSVVIHGPNAAAERLACDNLFQAYTKEVRTTAWSDTTITGSVSFRQDLLYIPTYVTVDLGGLNKMAGGWHTHKLGVPYGDENACAETKGHYNPFNIVGSPVYGTQDMYEVGDLSGKFISLAGRGMLQRTFIDQTTVSRGPRSIDERSIVIHRSDSSRWSCATLKEVLNVQSFRITSSAIFSNSDFSGRITFYQTHQGNDYLGDTIIETSLSFAEGSAMAKIQNWNILETTEDSVCDKECEVYNPFNIVDDTRCSLATQGQCIMGNLSRRHGTIPDDGAIFTDSNLPLIGQTSNIGRVLRLEIDERFYCAQVLPSNDTGKKGSLSFPASVVYDPYDFRMALRSGVDGLKMWQIVASSSKPSFADSECQTFDFFVIGAESGKLLNDISDASDLGDYSPGSCRDYTTVSPPLLRAFFLG